MSELTTGTPPSDLTDAHIQGMLAAANGHSGTHNPYVFQHDNPAQHQWREGFTLIRDAMDREYQRGIQNGQAYLLDYPDHIVTPPATTITIQGTVLTTHKEQ